MKKIKQKILKYLLYLLLIAVFAFLLMEYLPTKLTVDIKNDDIYEGQELTKDDLTVIMSSPLGKEAELTDYKISSSEEKDGETTYTVKYRFLKESFSISTIKEQDVITEYLTANVYEGDTLDVSKLVTYLVYEDGSKQEVKNVEYSNNQLYIDDKLKLTADSEYGQTDVTIDFVKLKDVSIKSDKDVTFNEGDKLKFDAIVLTFEDGTSKEIDADDCTFTTDKSTKLKEGLNRFNFVYNGKEYTLNVTAVASSSDETSDKTSDKSKTE